jgi:putative nucleotidyltransferase with HDIG domain
MPNSKRRVLFVDDEPNILEGLRRMLRKMRDEWEMEFVTSGREALAAMEQHPFDVVVSDMRMPEMDGAELLTRIKERWPGTVRLALSGHSEKEVILRSVGPTHQFLAKPCDADTLKATVARACALRELLANQQLKEVVAGIGSLPSVPGIYSRLADVLESPEASVQDVACIISGDVGMTAKILQLVNSAFFGLRRHVESPAQAISYLGLDTVQAVVLAAGAFAELETSLEAKQLAEALYPHSLKTAKLSGQIARLLSSDKKLIDDALMAGMLHDVGKLVFVSALPELWRRALAMARAKQVPTEDAEREVCGVSHAELGAYLLGLWGLPDPIVEAVAFHHRPSRSYSQGVAVLTAVHAANALVLEAASSPDDTTISRLDESYIEQLGLAEHVPGWRELVAAVQPEEEAADAR